MDMVFDEELAYKYYMDMVFDEELGMIFAYVLFLNHK